MAGLQTKGKFTCLVCGPKMRSRHYRSLRKEVFDEYRHFLSKNRMYRTTEKYIFNGKEETKLKPRRITPRLWKKQYIELKPLRMTPHLSKLQYNRNR